MLKQLVHTRFFFNLQTQSKTNEGNQESSKLVSEIVAAPRVIIECKILSCCKQDQIKSSLYALLSSRIL